jgi:hypothetical protein
MNNDSHRKPLPVFPNKKKQKQKKVNEIHNAWSILPMWNVDRVAEMP